MMNPDFVEGYEYAIQKRRERCIASIKNKLLGVALISTGILTCILLESDATIGLVIIPLGAYLLTK